MPEDFYGTEPPALGWTSDGNGRWLPPKKPRIALIGGGPGGLFAAYILNQKYPEARLTLYEASSRLGGKIVTATFSEGTPFEAGVAELYEYKGPGGKDPLRLLIEEDLGLYTTDIAGGCVVLGEEILRDRDEMKSLCGEECYEQVIKFHQTCANLMPLEKYAQRWQPDNEHPWADCTFQDCLHKEVTDELARRYIKTAIHSDLATELHTCNGLNGIKNVLMDNEEYMQLYHVIGGLGQITDRLAEVIDATVHLGTRVLRVGLGTDFSPSVQGSHLEYILTVDNGSRRFDEGFDYVFVCLPNHFLSQIAWDVPSLCEALHKMQAHYDLPAHYLRVSLLYEKPWWKRLKIPGEFWMMDSPCLGLCVYDESARWKSRGGHVLAFLLAGADALLLVSGNQDDDCIVRWLLDGLPDFMRQEARDKLVEAQVDRYVGSINAQPGGFPAAELRMEHQPDPEGCPGFFLVGDYLFDSTLNAALMSANTAVDYFLENIGVEAGEVTEAIEQLTPEGPTLSHTPGL
jgi:monoamine oxidase